MEKLVLTIIEEQNVFVEALRYLNFLKVNNVTNNPEIMDYVKNSKEKEFIIATELGVMQRLVRDYPDKNFCLATPKAVCPNMKKNNLEDILHVLETEENEIIVEDTLIEKSLLPIRRMLEIK